jgi:hypothetical protein
VSESSNKERSTQMKMTMKRKMKILGEVDVSQGEMLTQSSGNNALDRLGGRRDEFNATRTSI